MTFFFNEKSWEFWTIETGLLGKTEDCDLRVTEIYLMKMNEYNRQSLYRLA